MFLKQGASSIAMTAGKFQLRCSKAPVQAVPNNTISVYCCILSFKNIIGATAMNLFHTFETGWTLRLEHAVEKLYKHHAAVYAQMGPPHASVMGYIFYTLFT